MNPLSIPTELTPRGRLTYDRTQAATQAIGWATDHRPDGGHGAIHEYGRVTAMGVWTDLSFLAQRFTGSGGMTWTLTSADQVRLRYTLIGNTMFVTWNINTASVSGGGTTLSIALPTLADGTRYRSTVGSNGLHYYTDNGTVGVGPTNTDIRGTTINLFLSSLGNWAASVDNSRTFGQIFFEVETY